MQRDSTSPSLSGWFEADLVRISRASMGTRLRVEVSAREAGW